MLYVYWQGIYQTNLINFTIILLSSLVNEQMKLENWKLSKTVGKVQRRVRRHLPRRKQEVEKFIVSHNTLVGHLRRTSPLLCRLMDGALACEFAISVYLFTILAFNDLAPFERHFICFILVIMAGAFSGVRPVLQTLCIVYQCRGSVPSFQVALQGTHAQLHFRMKLHNFYELVNVKKRAFYSTLVGGDFTAMACLQVNKRNKG